MKSSKKIKFEYIEKNEAILGGAPVIKGTRIPAERLAYLFEQGYEEENFKKEYPQVSLKKLRGALKELTLAGALSV